GRAQVAQEVPLRVADDLEVHARHGFLFENDVVGVVLARANDIGGNHVLAAAFAALDDHELALGKVNRAGDVIAAGGARLGLLDDFFHRLEVKSPHHGTSGYAYLPRFARLEYATGRCAVCSPAAWWSWPWLARRALKRRSRRSSKRPLKSRPRHRPASPPAWTKPSPTSWARVFAAKAFRSVISSKRTASSCRASGAFMPRMCSHPPTCMAVRSPSTRPKISAWR